MESSSIKIIGDMFNDSDISSKYLLTAFLYSKHFDEYLNYPMRGIKYKISKLRRHYIDESTPYGIPESNDIFSREIDYKCGNIVHPLKYIYESKNPSDEGFFHYFLNIKYLCRSIYDNLINMAKPLTRSIKLYRGIKVEIGKDGVFYGINSFTSCTLNRDVAASFAVGENSGKYEYILFRINIPIDTLIVPIMMCSLFPHEDEIIILSSGTFEIKNITEHSKLYWKYKEIECDLILDGKIVEYRELELNN